MEAGVVVVEAALSGSLAVKGKGEDGNWRG